MRERAPHLEHLDLYVPLRHKAKRRGLARPVADHAGVEVGVSALKVARLEAGKGAADLKVELPETTMGQVLNGIIRRRGGGTSPVWIRPLTSCLASTLKACSWSGLTSPPYAFKISLLATALNLARYTLDQLSSLLMLKQVKTSKFIFSPSLSQSIQRTRKSQSFQHVCRCFKRLPFVGFFTVGAEKSSSGDVVSQDWKEDGKSTLYTCPATLVTTWWVLVDFGLGWKGRLAVVNVCVGMQSCDEQSKVYGNLNWWCQKQKRRR